MAKKHFGRFLTLAAVVGAAAAGISYFLQYKSFHKELDEDFHDFEDDFDDFDDTEDKDGSAARNYVSLTPEKQDAACPDAAGEENSAPKADDSADEEAENKKTQDAPVHSAEEETKTPVSPEEQNKKDSSGASSSDTTVTVEEITE